MRPSVVDIHWRENFAAALAEAADAGRAVVVKPAGQGYDPATDEW